MNTEPVRHVVYLHGFSSSPNSSKAQRFSRELTTRGVSFHCPDLNLPDFESLTITRMLQQVGGLLSTIDRGPVALIGSSLGAFVAVHAAAGDRRTLIDRMILLAPALDFGGNRLRKLGEHGVDEWRSTGELRVFHHAYDEDRMIGYALYEDASRYDAFAAHLDVPTLVFQGRRDETVDPAMVERWAAPRANVTLRMLDDGHQLTDSIDQIWEESGRFLGLR